MEDMAPQIVHNLRGKDKRGVEVSDQKGRTGLAAGREGSDGHTPTAPRLQDGQLRRSPAAGPFA